MLVPDAFIEKLAESGIMERALALNEFRDNQVLKKQMVLRNNVF